MPLPLLLCLDPFENLTQTLKSIAEQYKLVSSNISKVPPVDVEIRLLISPFIGATFSFAQPNGKIDREALDCIKST